MMSGSGAIVSRFHQYPRRMDVGGAGLFQYVRVVANNVRKGCDD